MGKFEQVGSWVVKDVMGYDEHGLYFFLTVVGCRKLYRFSDKQLS